MADSNRRRVFTNSASVANGASDTHTHVMAEKRVALGFQVKDGGSGVTFTVNDQSGQSIVGPDGIRPADWSPDGQPYVPELPGGPLVLDVNDAIVVKIANATGGAVVVTSMLHTVKYEDWLKIRGPKIDFAKKIARALDANA